MDTAVSGSWINPTNVQADDGALTQSNFPGANSTAHRVQGEYGFSIPSNGVIDKVELSVKWNASTTSSITTLRVRGVVGGALLAFHDDAAEPTLLTVRTYDATTDRVWSPADFAPATYQTRLSQIQGASATAANATYDYVATTVTYHLP